MAKRIEFISPIGTAVFPHLTKPDTEGKYATKKYGVRLELSPEDMAHAKAKLEAYAREQTFDVKTPKLPIKKNKDGEECQIYASSKYRPLIVDAKLKTILGAKAKASDGLLDDLAVHGGSRVRIKASVFNYGEGLSLQLESVQVIEARNGASADGFDVEEGYEYNDEPDSDTSSPEVDTEVSEADLDF